MRPLGSTCVHVRPSLLVSFRPGPRRPNTRRGHRGPGSDDRQRPVRLPHAHRDPSRCCRFDPHRNPVGSWRCRMSVRICDRCGGIALHGEACTCSTPYSLNEFRRRHRAAIESARITTRPPSRPCRGRAGVESGEYRAAAASTTASPAGPNSPADPPAVPRTTAAAAVSGERAEARVSARDSISRPGRRPDAHSDAAPPAPYEHRPAPDPDWLVPPNRPPSAPINPSRTREKR